MELIPGLPDDIAIQCLVRIPYQDFSSISSVCRRWKAMFQLPHFSDHRKRLGFSEQVIIMAQARFDPTQKTKWDKPIIRLTLCEPQTSIWTELPFMYELDPDGLPMFCQLASFGYNVVVMGGWDPIIWTASPSVFIYNFVCGTWHRGKDMPGRSRSTFACASDNNRTVFVAGGHDDDQKVLRSALSYDVENDEWTPLPDMAHKRDQCQGVFQRGKFHVIGGFERSAQVFDVGKWAWDEVDEEFLEVRTCPRSCVIGGDGRMYMCHSQKVVALGEGGGSFQVIAEVPKEVSSWPYMVEWSGDLLVLGSQNLVGASEAYVLDLKSGAWTKVEKPIRYTGHIHSHCCLEI